MGWTSFFLFTFSSKNLNFYKKFITLYDVVKAIIRNLKKQYYEKINSFNRSPLDGVCIGGKT